ncbi:CocE/NonD family hydrolase [Flavobacteriaceae bacterium R38]|nr:CocE/NonD family hydrolase [Flavobacteriaceae bacterium R38]
MRSIYIVIGLLMIGTFYSCQPKSNIQKPREVTENEQTYLIQDSILIETRDGAKIAAIIVRNKAITQPNASILFHTIYARPTDIDRAKIAANKDYVGIISYTRGKGLSPDEIVPYQHEANDTYDIIDWISKQFWSDGRVGMYGGSYVGFTQWAATKNLHPALKTIVPSVSAAPGIAEPMENGIVANFHYPWYHYVMNNKYLDDSLYSDFQRWNNLYQSWYEKGTSYRSLDSLDGLANNGFKKQLNHPDYDKYWTDMMPFEDDFAKINIPVLSTTGYYDGGQIGALYYLKQHYKYNPKAEHYLLIGPYSHFGAQGSPEANVMGYPIDEVAQINITEIIFNWFDYIFKSGTKPSLLKDKINYQVMGANTWGHASTLKNMSNDTLTFYLSDQPSEVTFKSTFNSGNNGSTEHFTLTESKPEKEGFIKQEVDFSDRAPEAQNNYFAPSIVNETLTLGNGYSFITEPFEEDIELNGSYFGELKASINKKDMDNSILLYEQTPEGTYFKLTIAYVGRASYTKDISKRQLLIPGEKSVIPFTNVRMTSKKISKGSRIVLVLNVNKHPYQQLNYGTGKDVSNETIKDADTPLDIKWFNDSFIKIPIKK